MLIRKICVFLLKSDQNFCPSDLNTEKCDQKANKKSRKFFFSSSTFSSQYFLSVETILSAIKLKLKIEKDSPQKKSQRVILRRHRIIYGSPFFFLVCQRDEYFFSFSFCLHFVCSFVRSCDYCVDCVRVRVYLCDGIAHWCEFFVYRISSLQANFSHKTHPFQIFTQLWVNKWKYFQNYTHTQKTKWYQL